MTFADFAALPSKLRKHVRAESNDLNDNLFSLYMIRANFNVGMSNPYFSR
jgi:hypothetical protein